MSWEICRGSEESAWLDCRCWRRSCFHLTSLSTSLCFILIRLFIMMTSSFLNLSCLSTLALFLINSCCRCLVLSRLLPHHLSLSSKSRRGPSASMGPGQEPSCRPPQHGLACPSLPSTEQVWSQAHLEVVDIGALVALQDINTVDYTRDDITWNRKREVHCFGPWMVPNTRN